MREIYLKGRGEEFKGGKGNSITETQESILKALQIALGINCKPVTSIDAWDVIQKYEDRITLRYYTQSNDEIPTICIDGKEIYRKYDLYVPTKEEQDKVIEEFFNTDLGKRVKEISDKKKKEREKIKDLYNKVKKCKTYKNDSI